MNIYEKVDQLRALMREYNIDAYLIPTSDPHQSEYLPDYYKTREYISGFTGSAGTAIVTLDKCGLWTDGRYFTQAEKELTNSPFTLYRMGEDIDIYEFLNQEVSDFGRVGLDGKIMSLSAYSELTEKLGERLIRTDLDFISEIWTKDRPSLPKQMAFIHDVKYSGQSVEEKLQILREMMRQRGVDYTFIGALEDIAYLYNIRGQDIKSTPVVISYALISKNEAYIYIDPKKLNEDLLNYFEENQIQVYSYNAIYDKMQSIPGKSVLYLDPDRTNVLIYQKINRNVRLKKGTNLTSLMKALKNKTEISNMHQAYLKDGVALTNFFYWLESGVKTGNIDEVMASNRLLEFRKDQDLFLEDSFETISAYGANAAMPHYDPHKGQAATLKAKSLYLVDSGGQYLDGTTDITRTLALGDLTEDEKIHYTLVLKGHIAAMTAKFVKGTPGIYLDSITRYPINKAALDFNHGTGHGIGFFLGVHEGPISLSRKGTEVSMEPGMVFSIEPGIYIEGSHGIRIENIVYVQESIDEGYYELEPLSYVPIDLRPVHRYMLEEWEVQWLNDYHKACYDKLAPFLDEDTLAYLDMVTQAI